MAALVDKIDTELLRGITNIWQSWPQLSDFTLVWNHLEWQLPGRLSQDEACSLAGDIFRQLDQCLVPDSLPHETAVRQLQPA